MAKKPGTNPSAIRNRAAKTAAAHGRAVGAPRPRRRRSRSTSPQFFREVRAEARKITWTSRRETWITSVMVAIMVVRRRCSSSLVDAGVELRRQPDPQAGGRG